jgi:AcrR family transcriptional regulator
MARDADATRKRILDAALQEFAEKGLAGARVDSIAERAGSSARMLYVYFGSKEELYDEVLRQHVAQRASALAEGKDPLPEFLVKHFEELAADKSFVRLIVWEALSATWPLIGEAERASRYEEIADYLADEQTAGRLDSEFDPDMALLLVIGAASFPVVFGQIVRLVTGSSPEDPAFARRYRRALRQLAASLVPR